jgi:hypothetical protein
MSRLIIFATIYKYSHFHPLQLPPTRETFPPTRVTSLHFSHVA